MSSSPSAEQNPASPEGPDEALREQAIGLAWNAAVAASPKLSRLITGPRAITAAVDAVLPLLTAERERAEQEYPRQRKGLNPFLPDAPVRKTFTDEGVADQLDGWAADQRMRESWRDGDTNTYRYRANLLEAASVRLREARERADALQRQVDAAHTAAVQVERRLFAATQDAASDVMRGALVEEALRLSRQVVEATRKHKARAALSRTAEGDDRD